MHYLCGLNDIKSVLLVVIRVQTSSHNRCRLHSLFFFVFFSVASLGLGIPSGWCRNCGGHAWRLLILCRCSVGGSDAYYWGSSWHWQYEIWYWQDHCEKGFWGKVSVDATVLQLSFAVIWRFVEVLYCWRTRFWWLCDSCFDQMWQSKCIIFFFFCNLVAVTENFNIDRIVINLNVKYLKYALYVYTTGHFAPCVIQLMVNTYLLLDSQRIYASILSKIRFWPKNLKLLVTSHLMEQRWDSEVFNTFDRVNVEPRGVYTM